MSKHETDRGMSCLDFRRALYVNPESSAPEFFEHLKSCPTCAKASAKARLLEQRLRKTITAIPVPETLTARAMLRHSFLVNEQSRQRKFLLAIAASLLLVIGISGFSAWRVSQQALASDILAHVLDQPHYPRTDGEPGMSPANALRAVGAEQVGDLGEVLAASLCEVKSRSVAHLVLRGESGPVAVLLIPEEKKADRTELVLAGASTTLVAIRGGTIGIVGVSGEPSTELESKLRAGLRWQLL